MKNIILKSLLVLFLLLNTNCDKKTESDTVINDDTTKKVYGRFVPERLDDFAWENDRIAFRMYGPALEATGEISNGIDVWVKSTEELVIDKFYKSEDYHTDYGEGLDYYKVGPTLGAGGSALWENKKLNKSNNFVEWEIIEDTPLRIKFKLIYAPRTYQNAEITEVKTITFDAGSNLNNIEVKYITDSENVKFINVIGVVKHEGEDDGEIYFDAEDGIFAYWEPTNKLHGNTTIGVKVNPELVEEFKETDDHYLLILKDSENDSFNYNTGAAWSKSGQFKNFSEWKEYLENYK